MTRVLVSLLLSAVMLVGPAGSALAQPADVDAAAPDAIAAHRLSLSERGLTFIEGHEGFVGHLYHDSAGNGTIGYGHLLHGGACTSSDRARFPHGISRARAPLEENVARTLPPSPAA